MALANLLNIEEAGSRELLGAESPIVAEISFAVAEELPHLLDVLEHQDGAVRKAEGGEDLTKDDPEDEGDGDDRGRRPVVAIAPGRAGSRADVNRPGATVGTPGRVPGD